MLAKYPLVVVMLGFSRRNGEICVPLTCGGGGGGEGDARRTASRSSNYDHHVHRDVDGASERAVGTGGAGSGDEQQVVGNLRTMQFVDACKVAAWVMSCQ